MGEWTEICRIRGAGLLNSDRFDLGLEQFEGLPDQRIVLELSDGILWSGGRRRRDDGNSLFGNKLERECDPRELSGCFLDEFSVGWLFAVVHGQCVFGSKADGGCGAGHSKE